MKLLSPPIQAFFMTARLGTVHAAAHALNITQTAVTQRIKALEKRLSISLFVRSRKGMRLTSEGEALLRYCYSFQELEGEALNYVTKTGTETNVSICITGPSTIIRSRIIPNCSKIMKQYPNLLMQFNINDNEDRALSLRCGESQLAIIEQACLSEEMEYKKLSPEHYILVVPTQWKRRKLKEIVKNERIIDFDMQDKMTFNYLKKYHLFDIANKDRHFTNRTDTLALLISEEIGYGVLPFEFAKSYIANNQLASLNKDQTYSYSLVLAWFPRHQQPKYFSALINACE
jgi:LysR family transcriptional regulator, chromosome initiation inhibitor